MSIRKNYAVGLAAAMLVSGGVAAATTGNLGGASASAVDEYSPEPEHSRWGIGDEAGNSNTQDEAKVLEAVALVRTGKKYMLGHTYQSGMPLFPGNVHSSTPKPPIVVGRQSANTELFNGDFGQNGTQFDAFGHFGLLPQNDVNPNNTLYYNRFRGSDIHSPSGLKHLGVENIKPFFTRGVLIDIARHVNGNATLAPGTEITPAMVSAVLAAQGMDDDDIGEGDVVLFRTGWEEHWDDGTLVYYAGAPGLPGSTPGLGLPVARWLSSKNVACVGADNWGIELAGVTRQPGDPSYVNGVTYPVHNELLVRSGIPLQESMHLSELADAAFADMESGRPGRKAYEFAYVFVPLPLDGASGSPGTPMAIR